MLRCRNNSLYTGITNDIARRVEQHASGKGGSFTRSHLPVELVYREEYKDKPLALRREIQIKSMPKLEKEKLIKN